MRLPFIGGSYGGRSRDINAQRTINWYVEYDQKDAKSPISLIGTPGLSLQYTLGTSPDRGSIEHNGKRYAVCGNTVYEDQTSLGTIGTSTGRCHLAASSTELIVVDGSKGYLYHFGGSPAFQEISKGSPEAFPDNPTHAIYFDGYFIVNESGTGRFWISNLNDGLTWTATDFGTAEGAPDNLVALIASRRELFLLGSESLEVWYNSGDVDFPFTRFQGGFVDRGCAAAHSVALVDNSIAWLGQDDRGDRVVYKLGDGYVPQVISTPQISYKWSQYSTVSDAFAFSYQQEGHEFYVLSFPTANATWVWDAATGEWHERSSWSDAHKMWRVSSHALVGGTHYVGDYYNGRVYKLDMDTYTENGTTIVRDRYSAHLNEEDNRIFLKEVLLRFEEGVGLTTGQGSDPQAMLRWSKDGGHTYGSEIWHTIGKRGVHRNRAIWRNLGWARDWVFHLRVTDPVKCVLVDAQGKPR